MKIFLVEDCLAVRERLAAMIADMESAELVAEADTEESAIRGIAETQPDLVIVDLNLNAGSGMGVLRRVKAAHPEIRVGVLTNHGEAPYRMKCLMMGADFFFDKSKDLDEFIDYLAGQAVESCL